MVNVKSRFQQVVNWEFTKGGVHEKIKDLQCDQCDKSFSSSSNLWKHKKLHEPKLIVSNAQNYLVALDTWKRIWNWYMQNPKAILLIVRTVKRNSQVNLTWKFINILFTLSSNSLVKKSDKRFISKHSFNLHQQVVQLNQDEKQNSSETNIILVKQELRDHSPNRYNSEGHSKSTYVNEINYGRKFNCSQCSKRFKKKHHLEGHISSVHYVHYNRAR